MAENRLKESLDYCSLDSQRKERKLTAIKKMED
jgi:hypothetical protein